MTGIWPEISQNIMVKAVQSVCNRMTQRLTLIDLVAAQCAVHVTRHGPNHACQLGHVAVLFSQRQSSFESPAFPSATYAEIF